MIRLGMMAAALLLIGGLGWGIWHWPPQDAGHAAGWAQAIGTVFTLAVSVALVAWQHHKDRVAADRAALEASARILAVAATAVRSLALGGKVVCDLPDAEAAHIRFIDVRFSAWLEALQRLDLASLPSSSAVTSTLQSIGAVSSFLQEIRHTAGNKFQRDHDAAVIRRLARELTGNLEQQASHLEEELATLRQNRPAGSASRSQL